MCWICSWSRFQSRSSLPFGPCARPGQLQIRARTSRDRVTASSGRCRSLPRDRGAPASRARREPRATCRCRIPRRDGCAAPAACRARADERPARRAAAGRGASARLERKRGHSRQRSPQGPDTPSRSGSSAVHRPSSPCPGRSVRGRLPPPSRRTALLLVVVSAAARPPARRGAGRPARRRPSPTTSARPRPAAPRRPAPRRCARWPGRRRRPPAPRRPPRAARPSSTPTRSRRRRGWSAASTAAHGAPRRRRGRASRWATSTTTPPRSGSARPTSPRCGSPTGTRSAASPICAGARRCADPAARQRPAGAPSTATGGS